jgi:hypothetical protein
MKTRIKFPVEFSSGFFTSEVYWPYTLLNFAVFCTVYIPEFSTKYIRIVTGINSCEIYHVPKQSPEIKIILIIDNTVC